MTSNINRGARVLACLMAAADLALGACAAKAQTPPNGARPQTGGSAPAAPIAALQQTPWQLVKFQGGDGTTVTPDDRTKYTIDLKPEGQVNVRFDCNRGRGTWKSSAAGQLQFGPMMLTRAQCPEGSLHDRMAKQWPSIGSYVMKDGHLFLALTADGGTYEFEPMIVPRK